MDKNKSSIWLDFFSYIFLPFYSFVLSLETLNMYKTNNILLKILLTIYLLFTIFVLYNTIKKSKKGYYSLYPFYVTSIISIALFFINKFNIINIFYKVELIVVSLLIWCIPNIIYIYKRKDMFRKHNVAHIKKCPGCNRIIPINMKCCGKCNYKED